MACQNLVGVLAADKKEHITNKNVPLFLIFIFQNHFLTDKRDISVLQVKSQIFFQNSKNKDMTKNPLNPRVAGAGADERAAGAGADEPCCSSLIKA